MQLVLNIIRRCFNELARARASFNHADHISSLGVDHDLVVILGGIWLEVKVVAIVPCSLLSLTEVLRLAHLIRCRIIMNMSAHTLVHIVARFNVEVVQVSLLTSLFPRINLFDFKRRFFLVGINLR